MIRGRGAPAFVSGMVAGVPGQGGATWAVLQYVFGLRALGYDPYVVESVAAGGLASDVEDYFRDVLEAADLGGRASLLEEGGRALGLSRDRVRSAADEAVFLLDLAGNLREPELAERIPVRVYVDLDPAFTQLWQAVEGIDMRLDGHTHFATVGQDIGGAGCDIPDLGVDWIPTLPPVDLDRWPVAPPPESGAWTTLANWRGYGSIVHDDRHYGQKAHAFRQIMDLPGRTVERLEVALAIHADEVDDLTALSENGWSLVDPDRAASTPGRYRDFIARSRGEIGIAKTGYVEADCAWFSDRSACYLATGRPVVARDTGFSRHLPTGLGLLSFRTAEEAASALEAVEREYPSHARAAREIAAAHFDARKVLSRLLGRIGVA